MLVMLLARKHRVVCALLYISAALTMFALAQAAKTLQYEGLSSTFATVPHAVACAWRTERDSRYRPDRLYYVICPCILE